MIPTLSFKLTDLKADEATPGQFTGRASVYGVVDSYGDVVIPGAFTKSLQESGGECVVLYQHDPSRPIGKARLVDGEDALHVTATIIQDTQDGREAYALIKAGLIDGISIGYEVPVGGDKWNKAGIRELHEIKLWEVSLVTFPANAFARVTAVKSLIDLAHQVMAEAKAGRVLSAANLKKVQDAHEALSVAMKALQDLIDLGADDGKGTTTPEGKGAAPDTASAITPESLTDLRAFLTDIQSFARSEA